MNSIGNKIKSKDFKDRLNGYDELLTLFNSIQDPNSNEFSKYSSCFEKLLLIDPQPANKEKALHVLLVFLDKASFIHLASTPLSFYSDLISSLVENCFSARDSIKLKSIDCLLLLTEIIGPYIVMQYVCEILSNSSGKAPKVIVSCIYTLKEIIKQFGIVNVPVDLILKDLLSYFEHQSKDVRVEALNLSVSLYIWLGDQITNHLKSLRPAQFKDFEQAINNSNNTAKPTSLRSYRSTANTKQTKQQQQSIAAAANELKLQSQQAQQSQQTPNPLSTSSSIPIVNNINTNNNNNNNTNNTVATTPPSSSSPTLSTHTSSSSYSTSPSIDLTTPLHADEIHIKLYEFYRLSEDPSWAIRKQGIAEVFIPLITHEKISQLSDQDYSKISYTMAKLLGDSNIFVILTTINATELLVKKLPRDLFFNHIISLVPIMLDSFKEKRPLLCDSIHACLNTIMDRQLKIGEVLDFIIELLLNSKVSKLKYEVMLWFRRLIMASSLSNYKNDVSLMVNALSLNIDDPIKENKEIAILTISTIGLIVGEKEILPLLLHLEEAKINQIKEIMKETTIHSNWSKGTKKSDLNQTVNNNNNNNSNNNGLVSSPSVSTPTSKLKTLMTNITNSPSSPFLENKPLNNNSKAKPVFKLEPELTPIVPKQQQSLSTPSLPTFEQNSTPSSSQPQSPLIKSSNNINFENVNNNNNNNFNGNGIIGNLNLIREIEDIKNTLNNKLNSLIGYTKELELKNQILEKTSGNNSPNNNGGGSGNDGGNGTTDDQNHDYRFYENLNIELSKELQNEKEKKGLLLDKMKDYDKQMNDLISTFRLLSHENKELKQQINIQDHDIRILNEVMKKDEVIKATLILEINKLKESANLNLTTSSTMMTSFSDDPSRYLVELPPYIINQLPEEELELFEELYQENLRIIQESRRNIANNNNNNGNSNNKS